MTACVPDNLRVAPAATAGVMLDDGVAAEGGFRVTVLA
jgi:hypothetical protein